MAFKPGTASRSAAYARQQAAMADRTLKLTEALLQQLSGASSDADREHWSGLVAERPLSMVMAAKLNLAGIDARTARALTVTERDAVLDVGAWCGIEDDAWTDALAILAR